MTLPPNELGALLLALGRACIELAPHSSDPARLRYRPPTVPPDLAHGLRTHKATILALLGEGYTPTDSDAAHTLAERLGMADGLRMPTETGSAAWLMAVGEAMMVEPEVPFEQV